MKNKKNITVPTSNQKTRNTSNRWCLIRCRQEMLTFREHLSSSPVFGGVRVAHLFSFMCCPIVCLFVALSIICLYFLSTQDTGRRHPKCYLYSQYVLDTTIHKQTQITQSRHEPSYKQLEVKTSSLPYQSYVFTF
jgi:hypothetical protein